MNGTDAELLVLFAREDSQAAFAELVTRHLDLVYAAARRQAGSPQLAEEIAQSVFLDLARQVRRGPLDAPLGAWLYTVTRRTAVDAIRRESRQRARERAAAELSAMNAPDDSLWPRIEPVLDEAMATLSEPDRSALVLRFFENKSLREVGSALGSTEDAAQKRVSRALEELRAFFARRGLTVVSAVIATELTTHAAQAAPLALHGVITAEVGAAGSPSALQAIVMTTTQKKLLTTAALVVLLTGLYQAFTISTQRADIARLEATLDELRRSGELVRTASDELRRKLSASVSAVAAPAVDEEPAPVPLPRVPAGSLAMLGSSTVDALAPGLVKAFGLTEVAQQTLNTAMAEARQRMTQLAAARVSTGEENGTLVLTIPAFPEGAAVRDDLLQAFAAVLGPQNYAILLRHYNGDELAQSFGQFGGRARTLVASRTTPGAMGRSADGPVVFRIEEKGEGVVSVISGVAKLETLRIRDHRALLLPLAERIQALPETKLPWQ